MILEWGANPMANMRKPPKASVDSNELELSHGELVGDEAFKKISHFIEFPTMD